MSLVNIPASRLLLAQTPTGLGGVLLFLLGGGGLLIIGGVIAGVSAAVMIAGYLARRTDRLRPSIELRGKGAEAGDDDHRANS